MSPPGVVVIDWRFNGPDMSANGGYAAGLLAATLGGGIDGPAEVRLHQPPRLAVELSLTRPDAESAQMTDGDVVVATARRATSEPGLFTPLTIPEARSASRPLGPDQHPFPRCFVCGPLRPEGDGLRIFPGRHDDTDLFGATWVPDESLSDDGTTVRNEFIWAALDCSTGVPFLMLELNGTACVLGTLAVRVHGPARAAKPHVLTSQVTGVDGRKRFAEVVLSREDGQVLAAGSAIWIALPGSPGPE